MTMRSNAVDGPRANRERTESGSGPGERTQSPGTLLELLGDETTRRVLRAVADRPRGGREVAERADVSRPTAYRRLNELQEAGLIATEFALDPDGNHHKQFHATLEELNVQLDGNDFATTVTTVDPDPDPDPQRYNSPPESRTVADD